MTKQDAAYRELASMDPDTLRATALGMTMCALDNGEAASVAFTLAHVAANVSNATGQSTSEVLSEWYARHEIEAHLESEG